VELKYVVTAMVVHIAHQIGQSISQTGSMPDSMSRPSTLTDFLSEAFYGKDAQLKRFTRELAAENFKLISGTALKGLPESADTLFEKRVASVEADILNLALWGMTAQEWRIKHPQEDQRENMRDFTTPEELKTMSSLQVLSQEMHEERLDRLTIKADELIRHYYNNDEKRNLLGLTQHKRGWGKFDL